MRLDDVANDVITLDSEEEKVGMHGAIVTIKHIVDR